MFIQPEGIILEQLASSMSVLTEDEKDLGVCLVDIGVELQILLFIIMVQLNIHHQFL